MVRVRENIPTTSVLYDDQSKSDYFDSYSVALDKKDLPASQLYLALAKSTPGWVNKLMFFRDKVAALANIQPVGSLGKSAHEDAPMIKIGDKFDAFKLWYLTDDELIVGEDDTHLNFRLSVHKTMEEKNEMLVLSMVVSVNNLTGKIYLFFILPFHKIIMKLYLKRAKINGYV